MASKEKDRICKKCKQPCYGTICNSCRKKKGASLAKLKSSKKYYKRNK